MEAECREAVRRLGNDKMRIDWPTVTSLELNKFANVAKSGKYWISKLALGGRSRSGDAFSRAFQTSDTPPSIESEPMSWCSRQRSQTRFSSVTSLEHRLLQQPSCVCCDRNFSSISTSTTRFKLLPTWMLVPRMMSLRLRMRNWSCSRSTRRHWRISSGGGMRRARRTLQAGRSDFR